MLALLLVMWLPNCNCKIPTIKSQCLVYSRLIFIEEKNNGGGDDGCANISGKSPKMVEKVKVDIVVHENENETRTSMLISSYFNIALFTKTYNI